MRIADKIKKIADLQKRADKAVLEIVRADPWVEIVLRDKNTYKLEYGLDAATQIFRTLSKNVFVGEISHSDILSPETFPVLLLAGLQYHHPEIGLDELSKLITTRHMVYYAGCINKALTAIQPDQSTLEELYSEVDDMKEEREEEDPLGGTHTSFDSGQSVDISDALMPNPGE